MYILIELCSVFTASKAQESLWDLKLINSFPHLFVTSPKDVTPKSLCFAEISPNTGGQVLYHVLLQYSCIAQTYFVGSVELITHSPYGVQ